MATERESLTEEEIAALVAELDESRSQSPTTRLFSVELASSPYVTFDGELLVKFQERITEYEQADSPVFMLDMSNGQIIACMCVEAPGAMHAVEMAGDIFKAVAEQCGVRVTALDVAFAYLTPALRMSEEQPEEDEEA